MARPADDLFVSGGGSSRVSTGEMATQAQNLRALADTMERCRRELASVDRLIDGSQIVAKDAPYSAGWAERAIDDAGVMLHLATAEAALLAAALEAAAEGYGAVERGVASASRMLAAQLAYGLGAIFPFMLPGLGAAAVAVGAAFVLSPRQQQQELLDWLQQNQALLSDPRFVELVRLATVSADEFGAGTIRFPPALALMLGSETLGILGLSTSAAVVVGLSRGTGALRETGVSVSRAGRRTGAAPPESLAGRAARVPSHEAQIRIDRLVIPGEADRFEVYLGGTRDTSLIPGVEAFDMTSNVNAIAMGEAGSLRAVELAMAEAGVKADSPVQFTGYSQGGLVAASLAASGDYNTQGLVTLGGPVGQIAVPENIVYVALEHPDDIIPATGGPWSSNAPVLVRREVFADTPVPPGLLPAHQLARYRDTAALADGSGERRLVEAAAALREFSSSATRVETTSWVARRTAG